MKDCCEAMAIETLYEEMSSFKITEKHMSVSPHYATVVAGGCIMGDKTTE